MRALYGRRILLVSWFVAACGLDVNGAGVADNAKDGGPGVDATVNDGATAPHEDASASDAPSAGDGGADVGDTRDANVPPDSGDAGAPPATSCKTLLAANPSTLGKNGFYTIDTDGADAKAPFSVYCEMSLDGGGWTLVGHSAPGGTPPFGWTTATGTASNLNSPFSLDVAATGDRKSVV